MIGIIAAMKEELAEIEALMTETKEEIIHNTRFVTGKMEGKEVVAVLSRVGKINATVSTMLLLERFNIDKIINVGSAGGLKHDMRLKDVVISTKVKQHDMNIELSGQPMYFDADEELVKKAFEASKLIPNITVSKGLIVSGDQFVMANEATHIVEKFPDALCSEMEAAAVANTCWRMEVPFVVIRSISDFPHTGENEMTFEEYLVYAARNSAIVTQALVKSL